MFGLLLTALFLFSCAPANRQSSEAKREVLFETEPLKVRAPAITSLFQGNADGTEVQPFGIAKDNEIVLSASVDVPGTPNSCPTKSWLEVEFGRAENSFIFEPTEPKFLPFECNSARCQHTFPQRLLEWLEHYKPYKWQARVRTVAYWTECGKQGCACEKPAAEFKSDWKQVGTAGPGYFSFRTPATFRKVSSVPHTVQVTSGTLVSGDAESLSQNDDKFLRIRSRASPYEMAVETRLPVGQAREVREISFTIRAKSTRACSAKIALWNEQRKTWELLREGALSGAKISFDQVHPSQDMQRYLLADTRPSAPSQAREVRLKVTCSGTSPRTFEVLVDQVAAGYEESEQ